MTISVGEDPAPLKPLSVPQGQERVLDMLLCLRADPPKVILLEGGSREDRSQVARFWAAALLCTEDGPPCRLCMHCQQVGSDLCREVMFLGEEEPLTIDHVRELRSVLVHPPERSRLRVVVFSDAQRMSPGAANGLLKTLEEPLPGNHFVLLAPVRQALLPTLVSRSQVLTLGWRRHDASGEEIGEWKGRLHSFFQTGQGLFEHTGKKGVMDLPLLQEVIISCQQELLSALSGEKDGLLAGFWLNQFSLAQLFQVKGIFDQALEFCLHNVNAGLVLDWLAVEIYGLLQSREVNGHNVVR